MPRGSKEKLQDGGISGLFFLQKFQSFDWRKGIRTCHLIFWLLIHHHQFELALTTRTTTATMMPGKRPGRVSLGSRRILKTGEKGGQASKP